MLVIESKLQQVLSDEDAVYLIARVVIGLARGYDPLLFARAFDLHAKTEMMTVLLSAFRCRSSSSVCWAVGHTVWKAVLLLVPSL